MIGVAESFTIPKGKQGGVVFIRFGQFVTQIRNYRENIRTKCTDFRNLSISSKKIKNIIEFS